MQFALAGDSTNCVICKGYFVRSLLSSIHANADAIDFIAG